MFQLGGKEDVRTRYARLDAKIEDSSTAFALILVPLC